MNIDWLGVGGILIGVSGLLFGLIAWFRPRSPKRRLKWTWISRIPLVSEEIETIDGLVVSFGPHEVGRATLLTVKIWNGGTDAIEEKHVRDLQVRVSSGRILGAWLTSLTEVSNRIDVGLEAGSQATYVRFDYLNSRDGCELSVLHDGPEDADCTLSGVVVGGAVERTIPGEHPAERFVLGQLIGAMLLVLVVPMAALLAYELIVAGAIQVNLSIDDATSAVAAWRVRLSLIALIVVWLLGLVVFVKWRLERTLEPRRRDLRLVGKGTAP